MAAIFVRLLIACAGLFVTLCSAQRRMHNLPNCAELLLGQVSRHVVFIDTWLSDPYDNHVEINNYDRCVINGQRLVGVLVNVCDPLGLPAPSLYYTSVEEQVAQCHTPGPCPAGLSVTVTQYCD